MGRSTGQRPDSQQPVAALPLPALPLPTFEMQFGDQWNPNFLQAHADISILFGGQQADLMFGNDHGVSLLNGNGGDDLLVANGGTTLMTGGWGHDTFFINIPVNNSAPTSPVPFFGNGNSVTIMDFNKYEDSAPVLIQSNGYGYVVDAFAAAKNWGYAKDANLAVDIKGVHIEFVGIAYELNPYIDGKG
ncbi:hypothetical protein EXS62_01275 [Candidatus Kaiserbacteria bacterium]|nr:hypothetical protein [Candidatus Kaiserbacteria bacterium]